jgi:DNA polymerase III subunit epsilon
MPTFSPTALRSPELLQHYRQLSSQVLTVVDVETTGSLSWRDRITELSVLQATLSDGILDQQTSLLNSDTVIPPKIVSFTGITQAMVDAAPAPSEVLPALYPMLSNGVLTAHNIGFDYPFLQSEFARLEIPFNRTVDEQLCTVELSRLMLAHLPSRRLPKLVQHFQFNVGRSHRAAADTLACWLLAERLLNELLNESDDDLLCRFRQQPIPLKIAAQLLGLSSQKAATYLAQQDIHGRKVGRGRSQTWMYRRGDIEHLLDRLEGDR